MPIGNEKRSSRRFLAWSFLASCLTLHCLAAGDSGNATSADQLSARLETQRQIYREAQSALKHRQVQSYRELYKELRDYPLRPYLDYYELNRRLYTLPQADVDQFLKANQNTYLGSKLERRWLDTLAKQHQWPIYLTYYHNDISSTSLQCLAVQARLETGDANALKDVSALWTVPRSQPKECDPLFERWIDQGGLTSALALKRFRLALQAANYSLARYLVRFMTGDDLELANRFRAISRSPQKIVDLDAFREQSPANQELIHFGIRRFSRLDPVAALNVWHKYDAQQLFDEEDRKDTEEYLALQLLRKDEYATVNNLLEGNTEISDDTLIETLIREALLQLDWSNVSHYITLLSTEQQNSERWQYWRARADQQLNTESQDALAGYRSIADVRSYYGFMAADHLQRNYQFDDTPVSIQPERLRRMALNPNVMRARELRAIGDTLNANREWYYFSQRLAVPEDHIAAAKLAYDWGWHAKTISSLAQARAWDDLRMRFPLAYNEQVMDAAQRNQVSPLLLYAIARQESAFAETAHSPAGAMGLMQLMPNTARQTASRAGVDLRQTRDLYTPDTNIVLGSHYITELLEKYAGNRILAAAAYNAGPHHVDRWLERSAQRLPNDVWIETIPFRETRKYVQNVLAYSVIYGYRTGNTTALLTQLEIKQTL